MSRRGTDEPNCRSSFVQVLASWGNQRWKHPNVLSRHQTAGATGSWRTSFEVLRGNLLFQMRDRRYLTSPHGTRSEQIASTREAHRRISPPRTPVNCTLPDRAAAADQPPPSARVPTPYQSPTTSPVSQQSSSSSTGQKSRASDPLSLPRLDGSPPST